MHEKKYKKYKSGRFIFTHIWGKYEGSSVFA